MIRINLLGLPRPKKGKRSSAPAMPALPSEGPSPVLLLVIVLGIVIAGIYYMQHQYAVENEQIAQQMKKEEMDAVRLAAIKTKYEQRQKQAAEYEARVKVIDDLRSRQFGPVDLLNTMGTTVNNTDEVWLSSMNDAGNQINLEGVALSANAVANLMTNLIKSGYFKNVEITRTFQDDAVKNMQAFNFVLVCEKAPPKPTAPSGKS
jgi:Tfp pilus assembly protein PilN